MRPQSLRLRLALGAGVGIAVALVIAGIAIGYLFSANVEHGARADLSATMRRLVALIDPDAAGRAPVLTGALPDVRYDTPASGLYWQIADLGSRQTVRSRSLWDQVLRIDGSAEGETFATGEGPGGQSLLVLSLVARFPAAAGERRYRVLVAQDRSILDEAILRFGQELTVALLILGVVLILATVLQVQLGLAPLKRLRSDVETVRKGLRPAVGTAYPTEILPLVTEVNELLASQQSSMDFARARAADLAHGLKTPLAVLGTLASDFERSGDTRSAELIFELTGEMHGRIDYQMRLARLRQRTRTHALSASLNRVVSRAVAVLKKTRSGEGLDWAVDLAEGLDVDIDANDLVELLGVILENAAQWARCEVRVEARRAGATVDLRIEDDGPGIPEAHLRAIGVRGLRLDETKPGTGLGLAIACEIVALNNGTIAFERSGRGGLTVLIRLPVAGVAGADLS